MYKIVSFTILVRRGFPHTINSDVLAGWALSPDSGPLQENTMINLSLLESQVEVWERKKFS